MRILKDLNLTSDFILQDIKEEPLTAQQLEELHKLSGNYEALFSKRAKLYKEMDLKNANLQERDFKHYILDHYTFLKRPVIVVDSSIFIGNSKKIVEAALQSIH
jgi:arsenate reductase